MFVFIVAFIFCFVLLALDSSNDKKEKEPGPELREDMEFQDLVAKYLESDIS